MKSIFIKLTIQLFLFITNKRLVYISFFLVQYAHSECSATFSSLTFQFPISSINVSIPANSPTISPVTPWYSATLNVAWNCSPGGASLIGTATPAAKYGSYQENGLTYNIYQYADGIGFVMSSSFGGDPVSSQSSIASPILSTPYTWYSAGTFSSAYITYRVRFIKYKNISGSLLPINNSVRAAITQGPSSNISPTSLYFSNLTFIANATSCTVNTSNIQVQLPGIQSAQLPNVGVTAGATPFNISLNCPSPVNVYMTMTDNSNPAQTSTIISAASGSTSQGVGVQIKRNGIPLALGPDSSIAGTTNQFQVSTGLSGTVSIPLSASYIRMGTVTGGTLQAKATFTMSYQ